MTHERRSTVKSLSFPITYTKIHLQKEEEFLLFSNLGFKKKEEEEPPPSNLQKIGESRIGIDLCGILSREYKSERLSDERRRTTTTTTTTNGVVVVVMADATALLKFQKKQLHGQVQQQQQQCFVALFLSSSFSSSFELERRCALFSRSHFHLVESIARR